MSKILCTTDFSKTSDNAITFAANLAQATHGTLTLLNVQSLYDVIPVEVLTGNQFTIKVTTDRLQQQCEQVAAEFGVSCHAEVEPSFRKLSTVIGEKSNLYDLVVMGTNGADDLYQFFLGSNAYNALTKANTPVMLVPDGYSYGEIKKIVLAFDYLRERKLPLKPLLKFARSMQAAITVLQVMEEAYSEEAEEDLRELQFILETQSEGYPLHFATVRSADVARSIDRFITEFSPDVLALCSQHRNFFESLFHKSVIKQISAICDYPVFAYPDSIAGK